METNNNATNNGLEIVKELHSLSVVNPDSFDVTLLDSAPEAEEITATYMSGETMQEGEEVRAIYMGTTELPAMNGQGTSTAVKLLSDKKVSLICASEKLVGALIDKPIGFMVSIVYLGKKKSKNGRNYDNWKVTRLFIRK